MEKRKHMQFRDLKKQYEALKTSIDAQIQTVITSSSFISGPQVKELETQLAEYTGVKHCITCGNGTDALSMALMAWDIKEGDAAFVPDFTFLPAVRPSPLKERLQFLLMWTKILLIWIQIVWKKRLTLSWKKGD